MAQEQKDDPAVEDLLALDDQRIRAMLAADTGALQALLSPDLRYTHSDGRTDTRASYLAALDAGRLNYHRCEREAVSACVHGEVAILEGRMRLHALDQGQPKAIRIHFLANWIDDAVHGWCLRAWASTLVERLP